MNIENLCMSFGTQVIFDHASVIISPGDKVGVVGVNGAGKSTLFHLILKDLEPSEGTITLKSKDGTTSTITVPYATNAMNDNNGDQIDTTYQKVEDKGIANGYVPLNADTKIDKEYMHQLIYFLR